MWIRGSLRDEYPQDHQPAHREIGVSGQVPNVRRRAGDKGRIRDAQGCRALRDECDLHPRQRGQTDDPKSGGATFREVADARLASRVALKPRTRQGYTYILNAGAGLDRTFGGYPLNKITRVLVAEWITRRTAEGKRPSTVRHQYFILEQVLDQAIADGRPSANPCAHVTLPTARTAVAPKASSVDGVVDPAQFLMAGQVRRWSARLRGRTSSPCTWPRGLAYAAELPGLQIGDMELPPENQPHARRGERSFVRCPSETDLSQKVNGSQAVALGGKARDRLRHAEDAGEPSPCTADPRHLRNGPGPSVAAPAGRRSGSAAVSRMQPAPH